jgi:hypothetical protein
MLDHVVHYDRVESFVGETGLHKLSLEHVDPEAFLRGLFCPGCKVHALHAPALRFRLGKKKTGPASDVEHLSAVFELADETEDDLGLPAPAFFLRGIFRIDHIDVITDNLFHRLLGDRVDEAARHTAHDLVGLFKVGFGDGIGPVPGRLRRGRFFPLVDQCVARVTTEIAVHGSRRFSHSGFSLTVCIHSRNVVLY